MNRILVIQDSALINLMLRSRLEPFDFSVDAVESAEEGLQKLKENSYQLIILDVKLPGMNGEEACFLLKKQESTRNIPVLFLSAQDESNLSALALKTGAQGYITLPFEAESLIKKINTALGKI